MKTQLERHIEDKLAGVRKEWEERMISVEEKAAKKLI